MGTSRRSVVVVGGGAGGLGGAVGGNSVVEINIGVVSSVLDSIPDPPPSNSKSSSSGFSGTAKNRRHYVTVYLYLFGNHMQNPSFGTITG